MKKAVVLNRDGSWALVLTEGQLLKVRAAGHWQNGDVVTLAATGRGGEAVARALRYWAVHLAGIFLIIAAIGYTYYHYMYKPVSTVSIDINPSIQLDLNMQERVVAASGCNAEGAAALQQLSLNGLTLREALRVIMESSELRPYLEDNPAVLFAAGSSGRLYDVEWQIYNAVKDMRELYGKASFSLNEFSLNLRARARELDVSVGKLSLALQVQEANPSFTLEELFEYTSNELLQLLEQPAQNTKK